MRVGPYQVQGIAVQFQAKSWSFRERDITRLRERFADEHRTEVGRDRVRLLAHHHELRQVDGVEGHRHVIAVDTTAMGHHRYGLRLGLGNHAGKLRRAAHPHHVRLQQADACLDQLLEPVAGVLVLAGREVGRCPQALELPGELGCAGLVWSDLRLD